MPQVVGQLAVLRTELAEPVFGDPIVPTANSQSCNSKTRRMHTRTSNSKRAEQHVITDSGDDEVVRERG